VCSAGVPEAPGAPGTELTDDAWSPEPSLAGWPAGRRGGCADRPVARPAPRTGDVRTKKVGAEVTSWSP
jgi:hypothetical protein